MCIRDSHRCYAWILGFTCCSVVAVFAGLYQDLLSPIYGLIAPRDTTTQNESAKELIQFLTLRKENVLASLKDRKAEISRIAKNQSVTRPPRPNPKTQMDLLDSTIADFSSAAENAIESLTKNKFVTAHDQIEHANQILRNPELENLFQNQTYRYQLMKFMANSWRTEFLYQVPFDNELLDDERTKFLESMQ